MTSTRDRKPKARSKRTSLGQDELFLSEIRHLAEDDHPSRGRFNPSEKLWKRYFQSPVDKAAHTVGRANDAIRFDHLGVLKTPSNATEFLRKWLELSVHEHGTEVEAIGRWLKDGDVLEDSALDRIRQKLEEETLENHDLYSQPVCRLVRHDQLRYDPNYQAVYQLTPGDSKLLQKEEQANLQSPWKQVESNRRAYWGISEGFQSLVAMFDSELGKAREDSASGSTGSSGEEGTKEFIRIEFGEGSLTPNQLNRYSPLRFWAPPPAFARNVFHMIFWRSVVTNKDLFNRKVIELEDKGEAIEDRIRARVDYYYVVINLFNAAKFRIARYDELLLTLMAISRELSAAYPEKDKVLKTARNVPLSSAKIKKLVYPANLPDMRIELDNPQPTLILPFETFKSGLWELARRYQQADERETCVSHLLKFLRDRTLELILWSKCQMEIRSIGIIPIQYLYRIELTPAGNRNLRALVKLYERAEEASEVEQRRLYNNINRQVANAVKSNRIDDWVRLVRVYGGLHRDVAEPERIRLLNWLQKSRRVSTDSAKDI